MELRNLITFIHVAELGSFTKAAEQLGYSQSTVSFQIKQLEKELGVQLFDRIGHTISLTDKGRKTLEYAQQMIHISNEMMAVEKEKNEINGTVRVAMADSLCSPVIATTKKYLLSTEIIGETSPTSFSLIQRTTSFARS